MKETSFKRLYTVLFHLLICHILQRENGSDGEQTSGHQELGVRDGLTAKELHEGFDGNDHPLSYVLVTQSCPALQPCEL